MLGQGSFRQQAGRGNPEERPLKRVNIGIGELYVSRDREVISTVLGSCVSVCLYDPSTRIGGMNHIFLPGDADLREFNDSARYGINAMELLINRMLSLKASRRSFRAKVFGGGQLLNGNNSPNTFSPGEANVSFAFNFLETEKIPVDGYNIGGSIARRIEFNSFTGEVLMKRINTGSLGDIRLMEQNYRRKVQKQVRKSGEVALF
jgi:chemotaxis protein CheD